MKHCKICLCLQIMLMSFVALTSIRADHYVAQAGQTPSSPFESWGAAASNIQDAVNVAGNGARVWVDDGIYRFSTTSSNNVLRITNSIILRSVNGADTTIIDGGGSNRCVLVGIPADAGVSGPLIIDGFTIANGYHIYTGGGIQISGSGGGTGIVQNCIIISNVVQKNYNDSYAGGGGIYSYTSDFVPVISNCIIRHNSTITGSQGASSGGGLWFRAKGLIVDSTFENNTACEGGGAMYFRTPRSTVDRCLIISNSATINGGAIYNNYNGCNLYNSLIAHNSPAVSAITIRDCSGYLPIYHCTVISNSLALGTSISQADLQNNIIGALSINAGNTITGYNNCLPSLPAVGEWHNTIVTTNKPAYIGFVEPGTDNFRLQINSPCINAGAKQIEWLNDSRDLDGRRRIDRFSGTPDIGCYEYTPSGILFGAR